MAGVQGWHHGGPWPGWLRWWYDSGGPARDAAIHDAYLELLLHSPIRARQQTVADQFGVSQSTVHRAVTRHRQRMRLSWPPPVSNGFGLSARRRRGLRLDQLNRDPDLDPPLALLHVARIHEDGDPR
jgi:hypothetical protein